MSRYERAELEASARTAGGECLYLRTMRLERVCDNLDVEPEVAALVCELADRVAALEREVRRLRAHPL